MNEIRVANAPCSWGTLEFAEYATGRVEYHQMLDELVESGYEGTELGDWGFMPTSPVTLKQELDSRNLTLLSGFVQVRFADPGAHAAGEEQALRVARLLQATATAGQQGPFVVLADENGVDPVRTRNAGRVTADMGLGKEDWEAFATGVKRVAEKVAAETGVKCVFHHHSAGYVETPDEIEQLLDLVSDEYVGLCLDTGHYTFGGGDPVKAFERFGSRIEYIHFKDCEPTLAASANQEEWDYFKAVGLGLFCELGKGSVDFPTIVQLLRERQYDGWIVVEQDVLPELGTPLASATRNRDYLGQLGL